MRGTVSVSIAATADTTRPVPAHGTEWPTTVISTINAPNRVANGSTTRLTIQAHHVPWEDLYGFTQALRDHFDAAAAAHSRYFGAHRPTSTVSGVVALALPAQLVEIGAVARTDITG